MNSSSQLKASIESLEPARIVEAAQDSARWTPIDVAALASRLAGSGEQMHWLNTSVADIASTGGPGSLSTLLAPLVLNARGAQIVKLGIPGRPAGAIDSFATIPGYRVLLNSKDVRAVVATCGFAHFLADERFAPADAALYVYRKRVSAVAVPVLACASLLAKKLAVGVTRVGLDVRVGPHGNFGATLDEARRSSSLFCDAARHLGIDATAFVSPTHALPQPWIGRGEALLALARAIGLRPLEDDAWLREHALQCRNMADTVLEPDLAPEDRINDYLAETRAALEAHLEAQGATVAAFLERIDSTASAPRVAICAPGEGWFGLDLARVRDALISTRSHEINDSFLDPAGIQVVTPPGTYVSQYDELIRVRHSGPPQKADGLYEALRAAIQISATAPRVVSPAPLEIIRA